MSDLHGAAIPPRSYIRLHDVTGIDEVKPGIKLDYFDFSPCQAELFLQRGSRGEDRLPVDVEFGDDSDMDDQKESDHDHYQKHFQSKVVSRKHATLRWMPNQPYPTLEDERSTHGTFLAHLGHGASLSDVQEETLSKIKWRQMEAHQPKQLEDGDIIQLGKVVKRGESNYTPLRLFVELYVVGQKPYYDTWTDHDNVDVNATEAPVLKIQKESNVVDLRDNESDDDVVVTFHPKIRQESNMVLKDNKLDVTVVLSDDESDAEDYQPEEEADEELGEASEDDAESSKEQFAADKANDEADEEKEDDVEEVPSSQSDEIEVDSSDDDPEGTTRLHLDCLEREAWHAKDVSEKDEASLEATQEEFEEQITSTVEQNFGESFKTAPVSEMELEAESALFSDSSNGSMDNSSDSEGAATEITNVEMDIAAPMKEVVTLMELDTTSTALEQTKEDVPFQRSAGTKRGHDEIDVAEESKASTTASESKSSTDVAANVTQLQVANRDSHKRLKTFSAGLATGLLAGMVGTLVGLSSLALSESSFL